jgi:hypothetical protein
MAYHSSERLLLVPAKITVFRQIAANALAASIGPPVFIPPEVLDSWHDPLSEDGAVGGSNRKVRTQHFGGGLLVIGRPSQLDAGPGSLDARILMGRTRRLALPASVAKDPSYTKASNSVIIACGFDDRAVVMPLEAMSGIIGEAAPNWALATLALTQLVERSVSHHIDPTPAFEVIDRALTPAAIYTVFPEARPR